MRILLVMVAVMLLSTLAFGQSNETNQQVTDLSLVRRNFRPKLTLQNALKLAEAYVEKEKINVSHYFLSEVRMIKYGGETDVKEPRWFFVWVKDNGGIGNQIEISVSMDGKVERHPSM
jgi:hypothetical protein